MLLGIYKRGQGKFTRVGTIITGCALVGIGCFQLYTTLQPFEFGLWVETMIPTGLFVACGVVVLWLMNKPSVADFMIASEGEMKKVNWSSRKEVAASTFIVIVVVFVLAAMLGLTDISFRLLFDWLLDVGVQSGAAAAV